MISWLREIWTPKENKAITSARLETEKMRQETDDIISRLNGVANDIRWNGEDRRHG